MHHKTADLPADKTKKSLFIPSRTSMHLQRNIICKKNKHTRINKIKKIYHYPADFPRSRLPGHLIRRTYIYLKHKQLTRDFLCFTVSAAS